MTKRSLFQGRKLIQYSNINQLSTVLRDEKKKNQMTVYQLIQEKYLKKLNIHSW